MALYEKTKAKEILVNKDEIKNLVTKSISDMAELVGSTLGPAGRTVLIERENLSPFLTKDGVTVAKSIGYKNASQNVIVEAAKEICLNTGKEAGDGPQPLYSKILTPRGFITMGDVKVGDEICGTNYSVQRVLGVYPKGSKEIYEIYFSDGRMVECCEDHLWSVVSYLGKHEIKTTKNMFQNITIQYKDGRIRNKYYTPITEVKFSQNDELPLHPYLIGVLLGDGSLGENGSIELSLGLNKEHIIDKIVLPDGFKISVQEVEKENKQNYFRVKISGKDSSGNTIHNIIDSLGLLNTKSDTKFIPKSYLYSTLESRKALLQGLLDTDGHFNKRERFEYSTVSYQLCKDILELIRGLGLSAKYWVLEKKDGTSYSTKPIYRIYQNKGGKYGAKIIDIKKTNKFVEMQCIKVSNPDNLYITDDYIVTHNTTSAIVLADALIKNGNKYLENNPTENPQSVARELSNVYNDIIIPTIREYSIKTETEKDLINVATISANGDKEVADVVVKAVMTAGEDGHVVIAEDLGNKLRAEYIDGYIVTSSLRDLGALGTIFINDRKNQQAKLNDGIMFLYNGEINDHGVLGKLQDLINNNDTLRNCPIILFAHAFSDTVLEILAKNFKAGVSIIPVKTPVSPITTSRVMFLQDMAAYSGGNVIDAGTIHELDIDDLGEFREAHINIYECVMYCDIDNEFAQERIKKRIEELNAIHEAAKSEFDRMHIKANINKISGGVSTIFVGGISELEIRERKARVEDAVEAVKSAIAEGIIAGGASMYLAISKELLSHKDYNTRWNIIIDSLIRPIEKMLYNCGEDKIDTLINGVLNGININKKTIGKIFDANRRHEVDPYISGIIEPSKVIRVALGNAISVASMLITLGGVVVIPRDMDFERQVDLQKDAMRSIMGELG